MYTKLHTIYVTVLVQLPSPHPGGEPCTVYHTMPSLTSTTFKGFANLYAAAAADNARAAAAAALLLPPLLLLLLKYVCANPKGQVSDE